MAEQQQKVGKIALDQSGCNFIFPRTLKGKLFWEEESALLLKNTQIFRELRTLRMWYLGIS